VVWKIGEFFLELFVMWNLSQGAANKTDSSERKILRKIFGSTQSKGVWRIRYNDEIYKMYKDVALSLPMILSPCRGGRV
jgi:hypothetical protein